MYRSAAVICWLCAALTAGEAQAQVRISFDIAVGAPGTDSFVFGTELWAVSQIELLPDRGIGLETVAIRSAADRVRRLDDGQVEFALVNDDVRTSLAHHPRSVMALWPDGVAGTGVQPAQLLVHRDVSEAVVYQITKMIFEHEEKLHGARATMGIGTPDNAIAGLSLQIHPGAQRYYMEHGLDPDHELALASSRPEVSRGHDGSGYVRLDHGEFLQLKAACRAALERESVGYPDNHDLDEICQAHGAAATKGKSTNLSRGQGGPKLIAAEGDGAVWQIETKRRDRDLKSRGLRPTM